jgi:RNA polymerase sigma-70 factor (ECF subfamily)
MDDFIHSESDILGATMSLTSQAIVDEAIFQLEAAQTLPEILPSDSQATESQELTATAVSDFDKDIVLARKAAAGNIAAFELIYQRHHRRSYGICLRMTQSPTEAEDLTQEVFIQLFRKIGSFRGDSAFTTWLHRMTVNQVLMHFRKRGVQVEKTTEDGEIPEQAALGTANYAKMQVVDKLALDKAVAQLPPGYRTVFMLHDVEGFEHEEIARMLGLSVGTSKSQLHKARLKLRGLLLQVKNKS